MGFLDELKKLTRPYDEDEDDYIDDAEVVDQPEPDRPRPNPFAGFGGGSSAQSAPQASPARPREGKVVNFGAGGASGAAGLCVPLRPCSRPGTDVRPADRAGKRRKPPIFCADAPAFC